MNKLVLDNKQYIVVEQKSFEKLQLRAAQKTPAVKKLSIAQAKKHAYKLIDKCANEK